MKYLLPLQAAMHCSRCAELLQKSGNDSISEAVKLSIYVTNLILKRYKVQYSTLHWITSFLPFFLKHICSEYVEVTSVRART